MTTDEPRTNDAWLQLELNVGRLFSAAPLSQGHGTSENLYTGRASEVRVMMDAVRDPAKHILLYGERGLGKTSLANTFWRNNNTLRQPLFAARVQVYPLDDFSSLWSRALEEFQAVMPQTYNYNKEARSQLEHVSPDIVRREFQKIPPRVGAIMIVDEFDLLRAKAARELTANLIKSLHDYGSNVTVILIGVAENVDELLINHQSLRRVLSFVKLERMSTNDLNDILDSRLRLTPLTISDDARSEIVTLSCGLPYYAQILGKFAAQHAVKYKRVRVQIEDVNAAIERFLVESGESFANDYQRATDSRQARNIVQEIILASALAFSDARGMFKFAEVAKTLDLIAPGKNQHHARVKQYLTQFASDRRGKILTRSGIKPDYRYRFSDALMQPFIIMAAIQNKMIDESLRRLLFHSGCRPAWP
jgi:Cdc6-like AAA superfamily ATPase